MRDRHLINLVLPPSLGNNPRPRDRQPVRLRPVLFQQRDVLFPEPIRVRRDIACRAVLDLSWGMAERVPDGRQAAVLIDRTFDLVGRYAAEMTMRSRAKYARTEM